ncbi:hypothetical protein ALP75_203802 [Pseudomonas syringae pv. actinidiae]|nr:hypothetical protein ALP75_203802 [Pseudomonas syringae pv. actinidiae]
MESVGRTLPGGRCVGHALHQHAGVSGTAENLLRPDHYPGVAADRTDHGTGRHESPDHPGADPQALPDQLGDHGHRHQHHALPGHVGNALRSHATLRATNVRAVDRGRSALQHRAADSVTPPASVRRHVPSDVSLWRQPAAGRRPADHAPDGHASAAPGHPRKRRAAHSRYRKQPATGADHCGHYLADHRRQHQRGNGRQEAAGQGT